MHMNWCICMYVGGGGRICVACRVVGGHLV